MVAHMLDSMCRSARAPENGCKMEIRSYLIGRYSDRAVMMHETAQKRIRPAPVVPAGCPGMWCGVLGPTLTTYTTRDGGLGTTHITHAPKCPKSTEL